MMKNVLPYRLFEDFEPQSFGDPERARTEDGFVYHITNAERAYDIADQGLLTHKPWDFTDQQMWPDGATEKRSYFSPRAEFTLSFAPEEGPWVLLRIRRHALPFKEEGTGDIYYTKNIPQTFIEYYGSDDHWHSVVDLI